MDYHVKEIHLDIRKKSMRSTLRDEIEIRMEAKNLSISALERKSGLTIHSVRNILKGRISKPSARSLQAIADALECSILDLMNPSLSKNTRLMKPLEVNTKKPTFIDDYALMKNCFKIVTKLINEKGIYFSVDDYLDCVGIIYTYTLSGEPKMIDLKFVKWVMDKKQDNFS